MSSLLDIRLDGQVDVVGETVERIQKVARGARLCLRFSGGKDSLVTKELFNLAGVPYDMIFSRTSVDPPELLDFIRKYHPDCQWSEPDITMFQLIIKKGFPPTRVCRYCCSHFKERNVCPKDGTVFTCTGIRSQESRNRNGRGQFENCHLAPDVAFYHPILHWTEQQVWDFIELQRLPYPVMYDEGFKRIGCVGCPLASSVQIEKEFRRWPNFEKAYMWAFEKMLEGRNFDKWKTAADVRNWYVHGVQKKYEQLEGQTMLHLYKGDFYDHIGIDPEWPSAFDNVVSHARHILLDGDLDQILAQHTA